MTMRRQVNMPEMPCPPPVEHRVYVEVSLDQATRWSILRPEAPWRPAASGPAPPPQLLLAFGREHIQWIRNIPLVGRQPDFIQEMLRQAQRDRPHRGLRERHGLRLRPVCIVGRCPECLLVGFRGGLFLAIGIGLVLNTANGRLTRDSPPARPHPLHPSHGPPNVYSRSDAYD